MKFCTVKCVQLLSFSVVLLEKAVIINFVLEVLYDFVSCTGLIRHFQPELEAHMKKFQEETAVAAHS
jgi:hypothetical protein